MKKILTFIVATVASVAIASADMILLPHVYGGFGLGTSSEVDNEDIKPFSSINAGVGVGLNIPFGGFFGFQPGIDYYYNSVATENKDIDYESTASYSSIDIPLIFTAKFNKFNFGLGPYLSIPVGKLSFGGDADGDADISTTVNFGLSLAAGYEERLGLGRCLFSIRYMLDFMPLEVELGNEDYEVFTRRALLIDLGYKVPLAF